MSSTSDLHLEKDSHDESVAPTSLAQLWLRARLDGACSWNTEKTRRQPAHVPHGLLLAEEVEAHAPFQQSHSLVSGTGVLPRGTRHPRIRQRGYIAA